MTEKSTTATSEKKQGMSLKGTIFGLMLVGALVPLGLYANFSYNKTRDTIVESANSSLTKENQSNAKTVQSWIEGNDAAVRASSMSNELSTMDPTVVREYLVKVNSQLPVFYAIIAIGKDGVQIARSNVDKLINVGDRMYFKKSMEGAPSTIQSAISKTNGKTFFTVAVPIRSQTKEIVGVMSALAEISPISDKITGSKIGQTGFSYLVDGEGTILAHPDIKRIGSKVPDAIKKLMQPENVGRITDSESADGVPVKMMSGSAGSGMMLVSQINEDEVDRPLKEAQNSLMLFVLGALSLTVLLSWLLANGIANKINELSKLATRISKARTDIDLNEAERQIDKVGGAREIRDMGVAIKRLSSSIRLAMRQ